MAIVNLPNIGGGSDPATINVSVLNGKVDPLATDYNGNIQNVNIAAGAGIVYSKLTLTDGIVNADINSAAAIANSKLNLALIAQTIEMSAKAINFAKGTDIASATTTDIGAAIGNSVDVTGTTTITGLGTVQAGTIRYVRFTGALILTHNATSLILPTGANITTVAADSAIFLSLGSGNWRCENYYRKDGTALVGVTAATSLSGSVIKTSRSQDLVSRTITVTTGIPFDNTVPQNTEGGEYTQLATSHTAASTANTLIIRAVVHFVGIDDTNFVASLFRDSVAGAISTSLIFIGIITGDNYPNSPIILEFSETPADTSAHTYKIRLSHAGVTTSVVTNSTVTVTLGGNFASSLTIQEIKA